METTDTGPLVRSAGNAAGNNDAGHPAHDAGL